MIVHVVAVGRVKEASVREACELYARRIRHYVKLEVREVRDAVRRASDPEAARRMEGEALRKAVPDGARTVALTRRGRHCSSEDFARRLGAWQREARDVALVIGGAHGLDAEVVETADDRLSLSSLTLPHDLARLVLLEQLYRACTIRRGEPYHKGDTG